MPKIPQSIRQIELETAAKCYIIGDIHGCYDSLCHLIEEKIQPQTEDRIIFLGDLIHKGSKSKEVLDYVMELKSSSYRVSCIRGNHEQKLLMAYDNGFEYLEHHLASYNSMDLLDGNLEEYLDFCGQMEYCLYVDDFLLSHVGFSQGTRQPSTDTRALFPQMAFEVELENQKQIHGHQSSSLEEMQQRIEGNALKISLDGGCVYKHEEAFGQLCALELKSMQLFAQANIEKPKTKS
jgi:serine/threonine protein phosphatase 1